MKENTKFWLKIGAGLLLVVLGIVLMCTVSWLKISDVQLGVILLIAGLMILIMIYLGTVPSREAKVYLKADGMPDIETERYYEAKKLKFGQGFLSRGKIAIPKNTLQTFHVKDGKVEVTVKSGKEFSSDLSDLTVSYQLEQNQATDEMEVSGYTLKRNSDGEKLTIYYPGISYEPDEWKDIAGVLSQASVVKESNMSKVNKWTNKIKGAVDDLDFSDMVGSAGELVSDGVMNAAANKMEEFAKGKLAKKGSKKGKFMNILKKIFFWIIAVCFALYLIFDVWQQIEARKMEQSMDEEQVMMLDVDNIDESYFDSDDEEMESVGNMGKMGFVDGLNEFDGNMIHTDGRKFPFTLSLRYDSDMGSIRDAKYKNLGSGTELNLMCDAYDGSFIKLSAMDGGKEFIIQFEGNGNYLGDAWWGDFHQDVELTLQ